jgi:hypothetical protein
MSRLTGTLAGAFRRHLASAAGAAFLTDVGLPFTAGAVTVKAA